MVYSLSNHPSEEMAAQLSCILQFTEFEAETRNPELYFVSDFLIEPGDKGTCRFYESDKKIDILLEIIKDDYEQAGPYCIGCGRGMISFLNTINSDENGTLFDEEEISSPSEAADVLNEFLDYYREGEEREPLQFSVKPEDEADWQYLVHQALNFADLEPWQWINSDQILVLDLPNYSERLYCCILGQMSNEYGVAIYVGDQGLQLIHRLFSDTEALDRPPLASVFNLSLCRPGTFPDEDRALFSILQMDTELESHWPMLRVQKPGYMPWLPQGEEISLFATILEKLSQIAHDYQNRAEEFPYYSHDTCFYRKYTVDGQDVETPVDDKIVPVVSDRYEWKDSEPWASKLELQKIKKTTRQNKSWIEVGGIFAPFSVAQQESEQPVFPWMQLAVEHSSGQPLHSDLIDDVQIVGKQEPFSQFAQDFLLQTIEKAGQRPSGILVNQQELYHSLRPLCRKLGIICNLSKHLPKIDDALDEIQYELENESAYE
ncbi:hypothetical protein SPSP110954_09320 [Sporolactobacillus spathodeae]